MLIDVSHCGPQTAYDAITYSKKPIIMSHVGAKGVWNTKRMASDEMIQAVAAKGGVVGIEAAPHHYVQDQDDPRSGQLYGAL